MKPAFVNEPIALAVVIASLGLWALMEVRQAFHRRPEATSTDRGSLLVTRLSGVVAGLLATLGLTVKAAEFPVSSMLLATGLVIMWVGILLRWWCFRTLGRYFTFNVMTSYDQPMITSGPYRVLRHPSYLGIILMLGGLGLTYGNWLSLASLILFPLLGLLIRIRVEEAALMKVLGAAYTTYASGRKRLVPYLW